MNIDKYIKIINDLNILIESVTYDDIKNVQKSIDVTKEKIDALNDRILSRLNQQQNIPYSEIKIEFYNSIKTSVRAATEKFEIEMGGSQTFDIVGFDEDKQFFVVRKKEWNSRVGLLIEYNTLEKFILQHTKCKLFFNKSGDLSGSVKSRVGNEEDISFRIKNLI
jgi:hypothetical protein